MFEPELFDIYLSYCQKSSSVISKAKSIASVQPESYNFDPSFLSSYTSNPNLSVPHWSVKLPSEYHHEATLKQTIPELSTAGTSGIPAGTTHVVTDKGGHTIYDSELKLLLDSQKSDSQSKKLIEDFTTYKHGSFLLFSQRGLLETLPLTYTCLSVTGNATVLEPSILTLPHVPEYQPHQQHTQVAFISKTSGYKYPSLVGSERDQHDAGFQYRAPTSVHPIPQILANISTAPKELVMQVESLKSGVAYSALLKFPHPVLLTDISIPATGSMCSVSVDVWLKAEEESLCVRVAQSSEIKTRSLMLGNLTPPPLCQYVKVRALFDRHDIR